MRTAHRPVRRKLSPGRACMAQGLIRNRNELRMCISCDITSTHKEMKRADAHAVSLQGILPLSPMLSKTEGGLRHATTKYICKKRHCLPVPHAKSLSIFTVVAFGYHIFTPNIVTSCLFAGSTRTPFILNFLLSSFLAVSI